MTLDVSLRGSRDPNLSRDMLLGQLVLVLQKWVLGTSSRCRPRRQRKLWRILGARGGGTDDLRLAHTEIWIILSG